MSIVEEFFLEIDANWPDGGEKQPLRIIGSGALMLQTDYERVTNDGDVFETTDLTADVRARLRAIAGRNTELHNRRLMYIDIVAMGIPFLPHGALWHPLTKFNARLRRLELSVLDVVDVVVSKLKPFRPRDISDIEAMIDRELVPHAVLLERFKSAVTELAHTAYAEDLPRCVANLNRVERDLFDVSESEIELPSWV